MIVYFVMQKDMEKSIILKPRCPESASEYEGKQPKICVSPSILGALSSIGKNLGLMCNTYIHSCDLDESEIIQPGCNVDDVDMTGEMWILIGKKFELYKILKLTDASSFCIDKIKGTEVLILNLM